MKKIILLIIVLITFTGCTFNQTNELEIKHEVIRTFYKAYANKDYDEMN